MTFFETYFVTSLLHREHGQKTISKDVPAWFLGSPSMTRPSYIMGGRTLLLSCHNPSHSRELDEPSKSAGMECKFKVATELRNMLWTYVAAVETSCLKLQNIEVSPPHKLIKKKLNKIFINRDGIRRWTIFRVKSLTGFYFTILESAKDKLI